MKGAIRALAFTAVLPAATLSAAPTYPDVVRTSLYVPVRDGTKLAVNIYRPARDGIAEDLAANRAHPLGGFVATARLDRA